MSDAMKTPSAWALERAMACFQELDATLDPATDPATDAEALQSASGGVYNKLYALVRAVGEAEAFADSIKYRIDDLAIRKARYDARARSLRNAVVSIMDILGEQKLTQPDFTVSVRAGSPGVVITDADNLPDRFVKITRAPDKAALKVALSDGEVIDGVEWSNPRPSLTIRTK
ncbi:MAG: siphovirus Gp157 family protein [Acidobacteriaceae bacterium]|nr:siphovirus Gp157 family protein [Acidobacteriaceae bacterium]